MRACILSSFKFCTLCLFITKVSVLFTITTHKFLSSVYLFCLLKTDRNRLRSTVFGRWHCCILQVSTILLSYVKKSSNFGGVVYSLSKWFFNPSIVQSNLYTLKYLFTIPVYPDLISSGKHLQEFIWSDIVPINACFQNWSYPLLFQNFTNALGLHAPEEVFLWFKICEWKRMVYLVGN